MKNFFKRFHTAGVASACVSLFGILSDPHVLNLLPTKVAALVTAGGIVLQAFTKPIHAGNTDIVPREDA